jgi:LysR family hydrogen peroxide-inducible transcriptional activator
MNLQQLEYIVAVDNYRNFAKAAESCFVTQPTLSMMIKNLESELDTTIFDRSKQPVVPTDLGLLILEKARNILHETRGLREVIRERKGILDGDLAIGIIPTLSTYLIPLFLHAFTRQYPAINLIFSEQTTEILIDRLVKGKIDVAILVTPLKNPAIVEIPLFYEEFVLYSAEKPARNYVLPEDINPGELWLLEEGHCLRSQIMNLCELRKKTNTRLNFQTGNLEMLKELVRNYQGMTILPELASLNLPDSEKIRLSRFASPAPVREVSMALHRNYLKKRHIDALQKTILERIPPWIRKRRNFRKIEI